MGDSPGSTGSNDHGVPSTVAREYQAIEDAVDSIPELAGSGIIFVNEAGGEVTIRGGPRRNWVYLTPLQESTPAAPATPEKKLVSFWDRWGDAALNCGSAGATGVVIWLSGGTASLVVGVFALNSSALCGMSFGKAIEYDAWQEFEAEGGGAYKAWLTIETMMALADLFDGAKGAVKFLKSWKDAGRLAKLEKMLAGKKYTRKELAKLIKEIDTDFNLDLAAKGKRYISKPRLFIAGGNVLSANKFKSLSNHRARVLFDALDSALTLAGTPNTWKSVKKMYEIFWVQYQEKPDN